MELSELYPRLSSELHDTLGDLDALGAEVGRLRGEVEVWSKSIKTRIAVAFQEAEGTVAERNAIAETAPGVLEAKHNHSNAVADHEIAKAKLNSKNTRIEVWRSLHSSMGKGHM